MLRVKARDVEDELIRRVAEWCCNSEEGRVGEEDGKWIDGTRRAWTEIYRTRGHDEGLKNKVENVDWEVKKVQSLCHCRQMTGTKSRHAVTERRTCPEK